MERLFATERLRARALYMFYAATVATAICLVLYYRVAFVPGEAGGGRATSWLWLGMLAAELWFGVCWVVAQSVRWRPVRRRAFSDRLAARYGDNLPCVDIFVCTADPRSEPPSLVVCAVLSVMAYNYPADKLSVYLSDDGCSALTFYALWEASQFAKLWLPFCRKHSIEPRSPAAYFSESEMGKLGELCSVQEWSLLKESYKGMTERIDCAVLLGMVPEQIRAMHKGFYEWDSGITLQNHQPIVQVLIDRNNPTVVDNEGSQLPTLVYMAREKRPKCHHNFKAGAMNALIRVSSVISNSPIILNVDCDVYSNNSDSIRDALCFFLDEKMGHKVGFVQCPQNYTNLTKNDIYGNSLNVINEVELCGMDGVGGPAYIGTGCFHRREIISGRSFSEDYKQDWETGIMEKLGEHMNEIEEQAKSLATCDYECNNTQWGREVGVKYGCPVEDVITGLAIQCRGWVSVYFNPARKAFLGLAPTTLAQTLLQHRRFSEGNFSILLSRYCPFLFGHGKVKLWLQMGYCTYGLWAPSSLPTLYYIFVPSVGLLCRIPLFPELTSPWILPFAYLPAAMYIYSLYEALSCGVTLKGWWNGQRMWVIKRTTSYLFAVADTIFRLLGLSAMAFAITPKVSDEDQSRRYEQELMEFGPSSSLEFVIVAAIALLSLVCLAGGLSWIVASGCTASCLKFFLQIVLCGALVAINVPVYEAMFIRNDRGRMAPGVTLTATGLVLPACLIWANIVL
ncbi:hypothetical protein HU200_001032 [Digitaria exilis]|uniref:Cellulose synthase-like protein E6 n=1 Tax=Digitaria exilis TaxID=1010633 RepID=A0A835KVA8_9POAL|nr:hypothetical protein HU200_001032 [Digitaria exilis]